MNRLLSGFARVTVVHSRYPQEDKMRPSSEVDSVISATVEQLMKRTDSYASIGAALGLTAQSVGRRMRGEREWKAAEVRGLATYFGRSVSDFYAGPEALFAVTMHSGWSAPFPAAA